jgi:hypothetical protein
LNGSNSSVNESANTGTSIFESEFEMLSISWQIVPVQVFSRIPGNGLIIRARIKLSWQISPG